MANYKIVQFDPLNLDDIGIRWEDWEAHLTDYFAYKKLTDDAERLVQLRVVGGLALGRLIRKTYPTATSYRTVVDGLNRRFAGPKTTDVGQFRRMRQFDGEAIDAYFARAELVAQKCGFTDVDAELALQIYEGASSEAFRGKYFDKHHADKRFQTLEETMAMARLDEAKSIQLSRRAQDQHESAFVNAMRAKRLEWATQRPTEPPTAELQPTLTQPPQRALASPPPQHHRPKQQCRSCGGEGVWPHEPRWSCPAFGTTCGKCGSQGHYDRLCMGGSRRHRPNIHGRQSATTHQHHNHGHVRFSGATVNSIADHADVGSSNSWYGDGPADPPPESTFHAFIGQVGSWLKTFMPMLSLLICGSSVRIAVDTGAQLNILDETTFKRLAIKPTLSRCATNLYGYSAKTPIATLGQFTTRVLAKGVFRHIQFVVTAGNAGNLLSYASARELGLISEIKAVAAIRPDQAEFAKWQAEFPALFSGKIGCFNRHTVKLHIDSSVQPVAHKLRQVPIPLRAAVTRELANMLEQDIIEPALGPTPWVSAIVPVPKETPGEVRITSDGRAANKAIMRQRHICPTVDDLVVALNDARVITKLDLKSGYNQLVIDEESRYVTTFCTHLGMFRYKRLNMGINAASEIFQRVIGQVICGVQGSINFSDDIIVHGVNRAQHDERLRELLHRLSSAGLTLNPLKCEFARPELDFYGLHFAASGMSIQQQKLDALLTATPPRTAK